MPVTVVNLANLTEQVYTCSPREAVIAAYAQSLGDYSTWNYEARYGHLAVVGSSTVACGDFCALLQPEVNNA